MESEQQQTTGDADGAIALLARQEAPPPEDGAPDGEERRQESAAAARRPAGTREKGARAGLAWDVYEGVRISLMLRPRSDRPDPTAAGLLWLCVTDLVLNLVVSFLLVGPGGYFSYSSVTSFFFHIPIFLLLGLASARLLSRPSLVPGIAAALVALSIPVEIVHAALEGLVKLHRFEWLEDHLVAPHYYRFFWWWIAAALLYLFRLDPQRGWRRFRVPLIFAVLVLPLLWYYSRGDLWVSAAQGSEGGELRLTDEVLSAQDSLLDGELAALKPGRPGAPDLYFVGFAGDASQDVFLKELTFARSLFDRRFGTAGRSVLLANNPRSATSIPFATLGNLGKVLVRLGQVMNREEDILFLYLSSHGSKDHELEVSNPPLDLKGVTPEKLRRLLNESGIRWKVVVVSACFSGGFVDPLKESGTMVITAADPTHESFGCGFGEEFTWFGHAFVEEALARTFSFRTAFENARETIGKWEEERGETPSNPQMWGGDDIWPRLERLEQELAGR